MSKLVGITGATSGLGRRLVEILSNSGFALRCLVRSDHEGAWPAEVEFQQGDITLRRTLKPFVKDLDICIHLAAQVDSVPKARYFEVNHTGTENLCLSLGQYNPACRLIHCSTIAVLKIKPGFAWMQTVYTRSKYAAEKCVLSFIRNRGLLGSIVYPGIIFGPYDRHVIPGVIKGLASGRMLLIKGGEHKAHLIYVDDLCALFQRVVESLADSTTIVGKRYVSVRGLDLGVHEFIQVVAEELGYPVPRRKYPAFPLKVLALFLELFYRLFKRGKRPSFSRSMVNVLSGSIYTYNTRLDDPLLELGWQQQTAASVVKDQIRHSLKAYRE